MKYKVLPVDEDGFVDLTAKELEDMLEEAYNEGKNSVKPEIVYVPQYYNEPWKKYWWDPPYITWAADANSAAALGNNTTTYATSNTTTIKANPNSNNTWSVNFTDPTMPKMASVTHSKPDDFITYTK